MKRNLCKIVSAVLLLTMVMSAMVIVPVSAELSPLPDATEDYTSGVFVAIRTVDSEGNAVDPISYDRGQKVIFELSAYDSSFNRLAVDSFVYSLYDDEHGNDAFEESFVLADPETGIGLVETVAMDKPGMLRITADIGDAQGELLRSYRPSSSQVMAQGAVLIDALSITTVNEEPEDFDEFWEETLTMLERDYPADLVGLKEVEGARDGYKAYEVYINCYGLESDTKTGDTFTAGYLTIPVGAEKGSLRIDAQYQGQGLGALSPRYVSGAISFNCLAHSVDLTALAEFEPENPGSKSEYYNQFLNLAEDDKATWGEDTYGMSPTVNADKEKVYYRHMLLRDYQAIEFMTKYFSSDSTATEYNDIDISSWAGLWNGEEVRVNGGSQGGFQAIGVAALNDSVTYLSASIPWLCDIGAGTTKAAVGTYVGSRNRPAYAAGLDYVDSAFLAKRITCKADITAGLGDPTCPPSGVMAMYNNLTVGKTEQDGPFTLKFTQNMGHGFTVYSDETNDFLKTYSVAEVNGAFGSEAYTWSVEGSVLNIVSESETAVLRATDELIAFAIANAEAIKTIEIEGKFAYIAPLAEVLKYLTRVENIKIDVRTSSLAEGATNIFANAASLVSLGHVEFDAMGAPVADTGTYKKGEIALGGFTVLGEGILSGDRSATTVYVGGTAIPAKAFENAVSLKTVYMLAVTDTATIASDAFEGTSGVKIIVNDETAKTAVEAALTASNITNVTVAVKEAEVAFGDKTGAAGSDAKWKIKGSTLIISGTGAVTKLEDLAEEDKAGINNIVISDGITSISNDVIAGFTLERVTIKGATAPAADDGIFGVQSADFVVYVTPDTQGVGETLYGYTVEIDGTTAGDLNGDGDINATDAVILSQVLASWDVDYNANAADCNGDGEVNAMDSVLLAQYIANWDVSLGVTTGGGDIEIPGSDLLD